MTDNVTENKNVVNVYDYGDGFVIVCDDRPNMRKVYYRMGGRWRPEPEGWHFNNGTKMLPQLTEMYTKDCTPFSIHIPTCDDIPSMESDESEYSASQDCPGGVCKVGDRGKNSCEEETDEEETEDEEEDEADEDEADEEEEEEEEEEDEEAEEDEDSDDDCSTSSYDDTDDEVEALSGVGSEMVYQLSRQTRVMRRIENLLIMFGVVVISAVVSAGLVLRHSS